MFVAAYENVTYALDVSGFCENNQMEFSDDFRLSHHLSPLTELQGRFTEIEITSTLELYFVAVARGQQWKLVVENLCLVQPEVCRRRKKAVRDQAQASQESDGESQSSSGVSEADAVRKPSSGSSSSDSYQSVDSDVDSEVLSEDVDAGDELSDVGDEEQQEEPPQVEQQSAGEEENLAQAARRAAGTWKVYEDLWFYMTQAVGYTDVKMLMKQGFKPLMGRFQMFKALAPQHYGETTDNYVKTHLLLQAWAIWRAKLNGWSDERQGRVRQVATMRTRLKAGIRAADTREPLGFPLLENAAAHRKLHLWVPDVVQELLQP